LFDGIDNGKKLYVITCNETRELNTYLLNRPGRFHYHFMLGAPTGDEIREYMEDNLVGDARQWIDKIVALGGVSAFTYDVLRALAFELNQGYDLSETMIDLNIERERYLYLETKIIFKNGLVATSTDSLDIDMFNNRHNCAWLHFNKQDIPVEFRKYCGYIQAHFYTRDIITDDKGYHIDLDKLNVSFDDDWEYLDTDTDEQKEYLERLKEFMAGFEPAEVTLSKAKLYGSTAFAHKYLV
jgi:hypothetical protein